MRRRALLSLLLGSIAATTTSCALPTTERQPYDDQSVWWDDNPGYDPYGWGPYGGRPQRWEGNGGWGRYDRRRRWDYGDDNPYDRRRYRGDDDRQDDRPTRPPGQKRLRPVDRAVDQPQRPPPPPSQQPPAQRPQRKNQPLVYPQCGMRPNNPYDCERRS